MKKRQQAQVKVKKQRGVFKVGSQTRKLMPTEGVTPRSEAERWRMRFELGLRSYSANEFEGALSYFEPLLNENPTGKRREDLIRWLGLSRSALGQSRDAEPALREAYEKSPWDHDLGIHYASALEAVGKMEQAEDIARHMLSLYPKDSRHIVQLSEVLSRRRKLDEAAELLLKTQESGLESLKLAMAFAMISMKVGREQEAADWILRVMDPKKHPQPMVVASYFSLGDLYDKLGNYDEAFKFYAMGNEPRESKFTLEKIQKKREVAMKMWTPERIRRLREHGNPSSKAVFIIGMPRSGTTLTEQVLGRHPKVYPAGELRIARSIPEKIHHMFSGTVAALTIGEAFDALSPGQLKAAGQIYVDHIEHRAGPDYERVIDKMPGNIWHVGMMSAMMPNARFIFSRRDPRDVCLSCYFRNFRAEHGYSTDLKVCGQYCQEVFKMAEYWGETLAEAADEPVWMDSTYENLVSDPEPNARKLFELIGLEYDSGVVEIEKEDRNAPTLRTDQVGRKIDTKSKERWKRYEKFVGPIEEGLGDTLPYIP
ncbi:MAG: Flp pilus assembly protein TadD [Phycisphaerales bacterium]|jgi:Flp pilus assembly protein TadD